MNSFSNAANAFKSSRVMVRLSAQSPSALAMADSRIFRMRSSVRREGGLPINNANVSWHASNSFGAAVIRQASAFVGLGLASAPSSSRPRSVARCLFPKGVRACISLAF
jgi:hypothetical protein